MYVIIDIETTGGNKHSGKITEIAAILFDGGRVVDRFVTLVNPEQPIDRYVSKLTGITDEMVADAPVFADIADALNRFTANAIFVAHNVNFDYPFVREEFRRIGREFSRRRLCTVRMSRRAFPDLPSYSLDRITKELSIDFNGHHRAEADAMATVRLFEKIIEKQSRTGLFDLQFDVKQLSGLKSPLIDEALFNSIPDDAGIYYFFDRDDRLLFAKGTAHLLTDITEKMVRRDSANDRKLLESLYRVDWSETGSALSAKLLEAHTVLKDNPEYNRGRIGMNARFGLYFSPGEPMATLLLKKRRAGESDTPLMVFPSYHEGMGYLRNRVTNLGFGTVEEGENRNPSKVVMSSDQIERFLPDGNYVVVDEGRRAGERTLIAVTDGILRGFVHRDLDLPAERGVIEDLDYNFDVFPELQMVLAKFIAKNRYDNIIDIS